MVDTRDRGSGNKSAKTRGYNRYNQKTAQAGKEFISIVGCWVKTLQHFKVLMNGAESPGPVPTRGEVRVIFTGWGMEDGLIYGLVLDNVTIGGEKVESVDNFYHNQYVLDD